MKSAERRDDRKPRACACSPLLFVYVGSVILSAPAPAGDVIGDIPLTLRVTASVHCALQDPDLSYNMPSLRVGVPNQKSAPVSVRCTGGQSHVGVSVVWDDAGVTRPGSAFTFADTKDTVVSEFCYQDRPGCEGSPAWFGSQTFPVNLRLTYTAAAAGHSRHTGELRVTFQ